MKHITYLLFFIVTTSCIPYKVEKKVEHNNDSTYSTWESKIIEINILGISKYRRVTFEKIVETHQYNYNSYTSYTKRISKTKDLDSQYPTSRFRETEVKYKNDTLIEKEKSFGYVFFGHGRGFTKKLIHYYPNSKIESITRNSRKRIKGKPVKRKEKTFNENGKIIERRTEYRRK
jgi:hypothetical protein